MTILNNFLRDIAFDIFCDIFHISWYWSKSNVIMLKRCDILRYPTVIYRGCQ